MSSQIPRGPLRDSTEVARFDELVESARRERLLQAQCDVFPQLVADDVLVWCCFNKGGPPGKRYQHAGGRWLREFERDLRDGYFLGA